jgi:endo-1,4-beta-xylanase
MVNANRLLLITAVLAISACNQKKQIPSLHQVYEEKFMIGAAIAPSQLHNEDEQLIRHHVSLITPEDQMKAVFIHPLEEYYDWDPADELVEYAKRNQKDFHGHCLIWHQRLADWMFIKDGQPVSRELLIERMRDHIHTIMDRYKGRIKYWDVVNEALSDVTGEFLRQESPWYQIIGEDYIELAFQFAHEADPDAILFYNDYGLCDPIKRRKAIQLVKNLQEKNVSIHAIGEQGHWNLEWPSIEEISNTIDELSDLGIEFHITELDIDIYNSPEEPEIELPSKKIDQQLAERYDEIFALFREKSDQISSVTFWGIADNYTWLHYFPVPDRQNAPLLFNSNRNPKKAFWKVVNF